MLLVRRVALALYAAVAVLALLISMDQIQKHQVDVANLEASMFFVQLTDPQLGMLTYASHNVSVALDWSIERDMLEMAITQINRLRPQFVFAVCVAGFEPAIPRSRVSRWSNARAPPCTGRRLPELLAAARTKRRAR